MRKLRTGIIALVVLCAAFFCGCDDDGDVIPEELVSGYWMEKVTNGMLLSFEPGGLVYNYIYSFSDDDNLYYAYSDPRWMENCEYLMDTENDRLFIDPDRWFDIIRLTAEEMSLEEINVEKTKLGFVKYKNNEVEIVSEDRFKELFPENN